MASRSYTPAFFRLESHSWSPERKGMPKLVGDSPGPKQIDGGVDKARDKARDFVGLLRTGQLLEFAWHTIIVQGSVTIYPVALSYGLVAAS